MATAATANRRPVRRREEFGKGGMTTSRSRAPHPAAGSCGVWIGRVERP
jgi:hypothetical protein